MELKPAKVTTTISNKNTKEIYKTEEEWKAKGIAEEDIRRDVHVLMPKLDLFGKTKQVQNLGKIMTNSQRQHGIGSLAPDEKIVGKPGGIVEPGVKQYGLFKKVKKGLKKVWKSPLGKAAVIGGLGAFGLGSLGGGTGWGRFAPSAMKAGLSKLGGWGTGQLLGKGTMKQGQLQRSG